MANIDIEQLVNKEHPLSKDYIPDDLITCDNNDNNFHKYINPSLKPMLSAIA